MIVLIVLGVYLIVLPLVGVNVSAKTELIGGNYTNVTSDIGACIAAGGTLHLISQNRKRSRVEAERLRLAQETHRLLHYVCHDAALQLGHMAMGQGPGAKPPFPGSRGTRSPRARRQYAQANPLRQTPGRAAWSIPLGEGGAVGRGLTRAAQ